jgi:hypothetical protein
MSIARNPLKKIRQVVTAIGLLFLTTAWAGSYEDFFRAVEVDNPSAVRSLVQRGFDVNSRDASGQTGLFLALRSGSFKVAGTLLAVPTLDVNALNAAGESALMIAALKGEADWSQRLIERGAQVDKSGWTPLHYAATGPDAAVVKLLVDRGAAVNAASPNRSTPLMMAAQYGSEDSVDLLLARGADPRLKNDRGLTAADFARLSGRDALTAKLERLAR